MRPRNSIFGGLVFLSLAGAACAQLRGPAMGYLPEGGALRTVYGIASAGSIGDPFALGAALTRVEVSPDQTRALGIAADTGALMLVNPAAKLSTAVEGAGAAPDRVVFSPNGTAAVLWFSAARHIQVVTGLSSGPAVRDLDAPAADGDPAALAVSDDGQWVTAAWANRIYAFGSDGVPVTLPVDGPAEALCFFHGNTDVAVITPEQVAIVTGIGGTPAAKVIWTNPHDPPPDPAPPVQVAVGIAASFDNRYLSIAANLGALATFDLAAGTSVGGNCDCLPTGLFGMGESLFRLTGVTDGSAKVFNASTNEVWFVPIATPPAAVSQGGPQ